MTSIANLILIFFILLCSGQSWGLVVTSGDNIYQYDESQVVENTQNHDYDVIQKLLGDGVRQTVGALSDKAQEESFFAFVDGFIVTKGGAPEKLFHFTQSRNADAIAETGLRRGASGKVFTTPQGYLSPLQAQIDLALPPNRGLPDAAFEIDVGTLRRLGIDVPAPTQVGRSFNLPGGGLEVPIARDIPPEALRRVR